MSIFAIACSLSVFALCAGTMFLPSNSLWYRLTLTLIALLFLILALSFFLVGPRLAMSYFVGNGGKWSSVLAQGANAMYEAWLPFLIFIFSTSVSLLLRAWRSATNLK